MGHQCPCGSKAGGVVSPGAFLSPKALAKMPPCPCCGCWSSSPLAGCPGGRTGRRPRPSAAIPPLLDRQMLQRLREDEPQAEQPQAELDNLGHADWVSAAPARTRGARRARAPAGAEGRLHLVGPGPPLGPAHAGAPPRGEAEEGAGAGVQPAAHRVPADALRDADAGHPRQELPAAQGHGELCRRPGPLPPRLCTPDPRAGPAECDRATVCRGQGGGGPRPRGVP